MDKNCTVQYNTIQFNTLYLQHIEVSSIEVGCSVYSYSVKTRLFFQVFLCFDFDCCGDSGGQSVYFQRHITHVQSDKSCGFTMFMDNDRNGKQCVFVFVKAVVLYIEIFCLFFGGGWLVSEKTTCDVGGVDDGADGTAFGLQPLAWRSALWACRPGLPSARAPAAHCRLAATSRRQPPPRGRREHATHTRASVAQTAPHCETLFTTQIRQEMRRSKIKNTLCGGKHVTYVVYEYVSTLKRNENVLSRQ